MKNIAFLLLFFVSSFLLCAQQTSVLSADDFEKGLGKPEVQLLDVRTTTEYNNAHIKNSLQADWNNFDQFKDRVQYLDKKKPVLIYCAAGGRSHSAAEWLRKNGFEDIEELKGGMTAWRSTDKPVEAVSTVKQMTMEEYLDLLKTSERVLIDFGAEWCPPCKKMEPVLRTLQQEMKTGFKLIKIDGGIQSDIMKQLNVETLPTFIVYKNGKEKWRKQGVTEIKELKAEL